LLRIRDGVVEQAMNVMRNRIDEFGVVEPTLQVQGDDEIVAAARHPGPGARRT
jgi:preprotein translocase subunit SecD